MNHPSSSSRTINADDANRGTIIRIPDTQPGLLVSNGKQHEFTLSGIWQGPAAPALNQKVSFTLTPEGRIASIHVLGRDVLANETLSAFGQTLRSNGGSLGAVLLPYLHQQRDRMTAPGMVMSGAVLLGFYILPGWTLDAGNTMLGMKLDYTLNQLLGVQTGGADITVQFGFWRLLGCTITLLPWVTPWLGFARARLLNILPLLLLLALPLVVHARLHHLAAEAAQSTGQLLGGFGGNAAMQHDLQAMVQKQATTLIDATSWNSGYWLALVATCGLAGFTLMQRPRH
ncbi:hypothetical protein [Asaia bogorensis]|uniref:hypothetical protein n=1 Tax=Asaia bogorensis TaxID=91915 RepID=UPI0028670042|nr:hypothetical protein [Asaia bogorensis]MDR6182964.1 hypothetical protein [Asaia bogorensis NBRC 16594]